MRLILPFLILLALLFGSFAISPPLPPADLNVPYISIKTLDGQLMNAAEDIKLGNGLYEGLTSIDPYTFTIIPGVAERWDISEDQLTYTFHLRPDAKWSDGTPLTAQDFAFTWRIGLMPDTAPKYIDFLYHLKGGENFFKWCADSLSKVTAISDPEERFAAAEKRIEESKKKFDEMVGVKVIDDHTLQISLSNRLPYFLEIVSSWALWPLPRHIFTNPKITIDGLPVMRVDPHSSMLRRNPQWIKPNNQPVTMVTNGPYRLAVWRFKREIFYEANPYYWNAKAVRSKTIRFINCKTPKASFDAYITGTVDLCFNAQALDSSIASALVTGSHRGARGDVHEANAYQIYYYSFNCRPKLSNGRDNPFADLRVRKAFSMVIDKRKIVEQVTQLNQTVAASYIPPGSIPGYASPKGLRCVSDAADETERQAILKEARQLLAEAGYPDGRGFPPFPVLINSGGGHENIAQAIGKMWSDALGVTLTLDTQEWQVMLARRGEGNFVIARNGWTGDYIDPTTFLELFATGNGNNDAAFSDAHFDELLKQAAGELDAAKRYEILAEAERYVSEEQCSALPLFFSKTMHLFDPQKVTGVSMHPRDMQMFHLMEVKR